MAINGVRGASFVDYTTGLPIDTRGDSIGVTSEATAAGTAGLLQAALDAAALAAPPSGEQLEDIVVTASAEYHLFHCVPAPFDSRLVLHVRIDRQRGNVALAKRTLRTLLGSSAN